MRLSLPFGLTSPLALAGCVGSTASIIDDTDTHIAVCQKQSDWARNGKLPSGKIAISCPDHGIGDYGH